MPFFTYICDAFIYIYMGFYIYIWSQKPILLHIYERLIYMGRYNYIYIYGAHIYICGTSYICNPPYICPYIYGVIYICIRGCKLVHIYGLPYILVSYIYACRFSQNRGWPSIYIYVEFPAYIWTRIYIWGSESHIYM